MFCILPCSHKITSFHSILSSHKIADTLQQLEILDDILPKDEAIWKIEGPIILCKSEGFYNAQYLLPKCRIYVCYGGGH